MQPGPGALQNHCPGFIIPAYFSGLKFTLEFRTQITTESQPRLCGFLLPRGE
jgi:hypothetical protein